MCVCVSSFEGPRNADVVAVVWRWLPEALKHARLEKAVDVDPLCQTRVPYRYAGGAALRCTSDFFFFSFFFKVESHVGT